MRRSWAQRVSVVDLYLWAFRAAVLLAVIGGTIGTLRGGRDSSAHWYGP